MNHQEQAIVITGCGWVTPFAAGSIEAVLQAAAGRTAPSAISEGYWPVPDQLLEGYPDLSSECRNDPGAWLTAVAFELARRDSSFLPGSVPAERVGLVLGNALAGQSGMIDFANDVREQSARFVSPIRFPQTVGNYIAGALARAYDVRGPNSTIANGPASGLDAVVEACSLLTAGKADVVFAGGTERLTPALAMGLAESGVMFSDGACLFVLERREHAVGRDATALATIVPLECVLEPLSPTGGSDEPTEGQTSRPRREGPGGSEGGVRGLSDALLECIPEPLSPAGGEGRVRGFQDALSVGQPGSPSSKSTRSLAGSREPGAICIEHWTGRCLGALGAAAVAAAIGAARGLPVPYVSDADSTVVAARTLTDKPCTEPRRVGRDGHVVVRAYSDGGPPTMIELAVPP
ncbi:MAG: beta-ketoacyl synthase N-terminal-like domain-containing protein [Planctomycetota bacterium]